VTTNVYLDDLADLRAFDEVYVKYFHGELPARTTLQQIAPAERSPDKDGHYLTWSRFPPRRPTQLPSGDGFQRSIDRQLPSLGFDTDNAL